MEANGRLLILQIGMKEGYNVWIILRNVCITTTTIDISIYLKKIMELFEGALFLQTGRKRKDNIWIGVIKKNIIDAISIDLHVNMIK